MISGLAWRGVRLELASWSQWKEVMDGWSCYGGLRLELACFVEER